MLPPLFQTWMDELLPGPIPVESQATCSDCAMCSRETKPASREVVFFDPSTKCCTFMPEIWNFLVGAVLLCDDDPSAAAGRASVEQRIDAGIGVTPLGLGRPPVHQVLYERAPEAFGRSGALRCPHFIEDGGRCGLWRHRDSTCSTWFCKHDRGEVGMEFWTRLRQLLRCAEEAVALWCLLELELDPAVLAHIASRGRPAQAPTLRGEDLDARPDPATHEKAWGPWAGREREFYRASSELVRPLRWDRIAALGGARLALFESLVRQAYRALVSHELPAHLVARPIHVSPRDADSAGVTGYSAFDPLRLPQELIRTLHCFDGRPTPQAQAAIEAQYGLRLTPELLRRLVDFGILASA